MANAIYFDGGIGVGTATTELTNGSVTVDVSTLCENCNDMAVDVGLRIGGSLNNQTVLAGEFLGFGHRIQKSGDYLQFNSYLVGPSIIFYPVPAFQLSGSIGYSYTSNVTSETTATMYKGSGIAMAATAAYSSPSTHGVLAGIRLFYSSNKLEVSNAEQKTLGITLFIRYAHRDMNVASSQSVPSQPGVSQDNTRGTRYEIDYGEDE